MRKFIVCIAIIAIVTIGLSPRVHAGGRDRLEVPSMTGSVSMHRLFIERAQWLLRLAAADNPYTTEGLADDADPVGVKEKGDDDEDSENNQDNAGLESIDHDNGQPTMWHEVPTLRD